MEVKGETDMIVQAVNAQFHSDRQGDVRTRPCQERDEDKVQDGCGHSSKAFEVKGAG